MMKDFNKTNRRWFITGLAALILTSLIAAVIVALDSDKPEYYRYLSLMPITFLLCSGFSFFAKPQIFTRISIAMTFLLYFIRMVLTPAIMALGSYATFVSPLLLELHMNEAFALAGYECVFVFLLIVFLSRREPALEAKQRQKKVNQWIVRPASFAFPLKLRALLLFMIAYVLYLVFSDPTIPRSMFTFIFGTPSGWKVKAEFRFLDGSGTGTLGILVSIMQYVIWQLQAFLPAALVILLATREKLCNNAKIVLTFIIIALALVLATETRAHSIEVALALVMVTIGIYERKVLRFLTVVMLFIAALTMIGLMSKSRLNTSGEGISMILTSYFSGIPNIAAAIYASRHSELLGISQIIPDILRQIPLYGSLLREILPANTNSVFNAVVWPESSLGMIIPAIGQGYSYFGFIMAPFVPLLTIWLSYRFELLAKISPNILFKTVFFLASIMLARSSVSSNMLSAVIYLFHTIVSCLILLWSFWPDKKKLKAS